MFDLTTFSASQTFMKYLDEQNKACNYAGYLDKYLKYPPAGPLPLPGHDVENDPGCDLWTDIYTAALVINPAFNIYRIFDMVSILRFLVVTCKSSLVHR
jgi:carboxypeptidase D